MSNKNRKQHFGPFGKTEGSNEQQVEIENRTIGFGVSSEPAPVVGLHNELSESHPIQATQSLVVVDNCQVVNIREKPSVDSTILASAAKGTRFILNSQNSGWVYVKGIENPSLIGYIMDAYVVGE